MTLRSYVVSQKHVMFTTIAIHARPGLISERFRMKLKQPDKVEAVHKKLIVCLLYLLEKRPPGHELTTSQLLELVFELREVGELHTKSIQEIFEIWPISENHKLLKEFVSEWTKCRLSYRCTIVCLCPQQCIDWGRGICGLPVLSATTFTGHQICLTTVASLVII